jgi:uncharacterized RDD family membrane protein YckC
MQEHTNTTTQYPQMAGFWRRFGAHLVDSLIIGLVTSPFGMAANFNYTGNIDNAEDFRNIMAGVGSLFSMSQMIGWAIFFASAYFYYGWFYSTKGQTPGKMLMKIKVVKENLSYLDWNEAFIRDGLMKLVSGAILSLGYFWFFANPKRQTWHDSVVHSYVVQTDKDGNIVMGGPESYPASKAKAFAFPCGCCLLYIILIVGVILLIGAMAPEIRKMGENNPALRDAAIEYKESKESTNMDKFFEELEGGQEGMQKQNMQQFEMMQKQLENQLESGMREQ